MAVTSDEHDLLVRLRAGDEDAFVGLVEHHHAAMIRLAKVYVGSEPLAEEVVQEVWSAVIRTIHRFEARSSLKTWLFSIVKKRAASAFARERRSIPLSALDSREEESGHTVGADRFFNSADPWIFGEWAAPPRPWQDAGRRVHSLELRSELRAAVEELPRRQQLVVGLRDVEGLEAGEVCELMGLSEANQRVLLHRGRTRLRHTLEDSLAGAAHPG